MPALNGKSAVAWLIRHVQCVCGAKHRRTTECSEFNFSTLDKWFCRSMTSVNARPTATSAMLTDMLPSPDATFTGDAKITLHPPPRSQFCSAKLAVQGRGRFERDAIRMRRMFVGTGQWTAASACPERLTAERESSYVGMKDGAKVRMLYVERTDTFERVGSSKTHSTCEMEV
jgi:hypothetical protein